jgi:GTP-binding protein
VHRPRTEEVEVRRLSERSFEVTGRAAVRAVGLSDLTDLGALDELHRRLERLGVDRALARAGARDGDDVVIGGVALTWAAGHGVDAELDPGRPSRARRMKRNEGTSGRG